MNKTYSCIASTYDMDDSDNYKTILAARVAVLHGRCKDSRVVLALDGLESEIESGATESDLEVDARRVAEAELAVVEAYKAATSTCQSCG